MKNDIPLWLLPRVGTIRLLVCSSLLSGCIRNIATLGFSVTPQQLYNGINNRNYFFELKPSKNRRSAVSSTPVGTFKEKRQAMGYSTRQRIPSSASSISPWMLFGGFFDDIGKYFNSKGRNDDEEEGNTDESDDSVVVFTIPASSVKVGALRLLLMLHLMGQQNTPTKGTWKCQQREEEEADAIVLYFMLDQSASLSVNISDWGIKVKRRGIKPSVQFMMQESILLQGLIDQLDHVLYSEEVKDANRLLVLKNPLDGLDKARAMLPFT
jgi:hypothetical protein